MNIDQQKCLIKAGFTLIKEEGLPIPSNIIFRRGGYKGRHGSIYKERDSISANSNIYNYRIILYTTIAKFFKLPKGEIDKFRDKAGNFYKKSVCGQPILDSVIVHTMAHEIAHLKYMRHGPLHLTYTDNLFIKLKEKIANVI